MNLVIGGGGFVGTHLIHHLRNSGQPVRVLGRSLPMLGFDWTGVDYVRIDPSDPATWRGYLADASSLFYLASTSVPSSSNRDPLGDISENLHWTIRLFQEVLQFGCKRIIYFSSGGTVYGECTSEAVSENAPTNPICSYGIVKLAVEKYLEMWRKTGSVSSLIVRPSNPFGPRQRTDKGQGLVASVIQRVIDGAPITIYGDGSAVRDYIYVEDLVRVVSELDMKGAEGIYNVGSGIGISVLDVIESVFAAANRMVPVEHLPSRPCDVKRLTLDVTRLSSLGIVPSLVGFQEGVKRSLAFAAGPERRAPQAPSLKTAEVWRA